VPQSRFHDLKIIESAEIAIEGRDRTRVCARNGCDVCVGNEIVAGVPGEASLFENVRATRESWYGPVCRGGNDRIEEFEGFREGRWHLEDVSEHRL
jgi:hypothetical protein